MRNAGGTEIDWQSPIKLIDRPGLAEQYHQFDPESALAIRAALAARWPLLVRGEPGVGKTQLAAAAAHVLKRPLVSKVVDARTESRDLLWEFDAIMRLADAQIAAFLPPKDCADESDEGTPQASRGEALRNRLAVGNYVRPGPLWWAFDWEDACERANRTHTPFPPCASPADSRNGCVVLIDEIDKAESDVPNGLLEALGSGRFTPFGQTEPVEVRGEPPLVVITTNEERVLPNAFLRRCLVLELKLPRDESELVEHLIRRAEVHFPTRTESSKTLFRQAAELLVVDRRTAQTRNLMPLPGQAEYLDLLRAVFHLEGDSGQRPEVILEKVASYAVCRASNRLEHERCPDRASETWCGRWQSAAELQDAMARLLGLERLRSLPLETGLMSDEATAVVFPAPSAEPPVSVSDTALVPFWYADSFARNDAIVSDGRTASPPPPKPGEEKTEPLVHSPLASSAAILTRLRRVSAFSRASVEPDVERVMEQLSRGRFLEVLPRRSRKSWGPSILCIVDRHGTWLLLDRSG